MLITVGTSGGHPRIWLAYAIRTNVLTVSDFDNIEKQVIREKTVRKKKQPTVIWNWWWNVLVGVSIIRLKQNMTTLMTSLRTKIHFAFPCNSQCLVIPPSTRICLVLIFEITKLGAILESRLYLLRQSEVCVSARTTGYPLRCCELFKIVLKTYSLNTDARINAKHRAAALWT